MERGRDPESRRRFRAPWSVAGVVALVIVLVGAAAWLALPARPGPAPGPPADPPAGQPAPDLAGRTLTGGQVDLADLRGSVVLVHVWAAWCAPCRAELPVLVAAEHRLGGRGLRLVGIDLRDGERQARELLAGVGADPAASVADPQGRIAQRWHVRGVPETFVVDGAGTVRARRVGGVSAAWIDEHVVALLEPAG